MDTDSSQSFEISCNETREKSRDDANKKRRRESPPDSDNKDRNKRIRRQAIVVKREKLVKLDQLLDSTKLKSDKRKKLEEERKQVLAYII
jgi:hypothetical protein